MLGRREPLPAPPLVKVCGLTRPEDAALAGRLGAWAVGFVFAPSPRRVTVEQAVLLSAAVRDARDGGERGGPLRIGVFVDASPREIAATVETVGLDGVQLHGPEPEAAPVRTALAALGLDVLIIRAVPVLAGGERANGLRAKAALARAGADALLFDTRAGDRFGGTGASFPWSLAREAAGDTLFLVAGGISPKNAKQALAASGAAGLDVSGGVERSPGVKDPGLLHALFAALGNGPPAHGKDPSGGADLSSPGDPSRAADPFQATDPARAGDRPEGRSL